MTNYLGHKFISYDNSQLFGDKMKCEICNLKITVTRQSKKIFNKKTGAYLKITCEEQIIKQLLE